MKRVALILLGLLAGVVSGKAAPAVFSQFNQAKEAPAGGLPNLPQELRVALDMERLIARARQGAAPDSWMPDLRALRSALPDKPWAAPLREMALCWEARGQMLRWDKILRASYVKKARFPDSIQPLLETAPADLKSDPWGEDWVYQVTAPVFSPKLVGQRYQLGPKRYPALSPADMAAKTGAALPKANYSYSLIAGLASLEVTTPGGRSVLYVGQRAGPLWLVWVDRDGALLCNLDRFLPVAF